MNRRQQEKRILELRQRIERTLSDHGVELNLGPTGKHERALRNNHRMVYIFTLLDAIVRALDNQPTITVEDLQATDGVGPQTAERIVRELSES